MQVIPVELYSDARFFCPSTGEMLIGDQPFKPSPATLFSFVDEIGEFEFITDELQAKFDSMRESDDEWPAEQFQRFLASIKDKSVVCFQVTLCGMGCGPVAITIHIGVQLNYANTQAT